MSEILQENGKRSSMRIAVFVLLAVVLFNVTYSTVTGKPLAALDANWVLMVTAGLGAKVWQKKYEQPTP